MADGDLLGLVGAYASDDEASGSGASGEEGGQGGILLNYGSGPFVAPTTTDQAGGAAPAEDIGTSPSGAPADSKASGADSKSPYTAAGGTGEENGAAADVDEDLPASIREPPPGPCDPKLQEKVRRYLAIQREQGRYLSAELKANREYRNPDFLQKMVEHLDIDQYGTSYPKELWDPKILPEEDYYDKLQQEYDREMKRKQEERQRTGQVQFVKGSVPSTSMHKNPLLPQMDPAAANAVAAATAAAALKAQQMMVQQGSGSKRTKWDNVPPKR